MKLKTMRKRVDVAVKVFVVKLVRKQQRKKKMIALVMDHVIRMKLIR
jgi:hypothetical protein